MRSKSDLNLVERNASSSPIRGILLYLGNEETKFESISPQWAEVRALVLSRNKLAVNLKRMGDVSIILTYINNHLHGPCALPVHNEVYSASCTCGKRVLWCHVISA